MANLQKQMSQVQSTQYAFKNNGSLISMIPHKQEFVNLVYHYPKNQVDDNPSPGKYLSVFVPIQNLTTISTLMKQFFFTNNILESKEMTLQQLEDQISKQHLIFYKNHSRQERIFPSQTIQTIKFRILRQRFYKFNQKDQIHVYNKQDVPNKFQLQSGINYLNYQKNYQKYINLTIRLIQQKNQKLQNQQIQGQKLHYRYLYLDCDFNISIKSLQEKIVNYLNQSIECPWKLSHRVQVGQFILSLTKKDLSRPYLDPGFYEETKQFIKVTKSKLVEVNDEIYLNESKKVQSMNSQQQSIFDVGSLSVRDLCPPGVIINCKFKKDVDIQIKNLQNSLENNILVNIDYFRQLTRQQKKSNQNDFEFKIQKRTMTYRLNQMLNLRIDTLLIENYVNQPLSTLLYGHGQTFKPFQKFQQLFDLLTQKSIKGPIKLICITQAQYFYKQVPYLSQRLNPEQKLSMEQIIQNMCEYINNKLPPNKLKSYENIIKKHHQKKNQLLNQLLQSGIQYSQQEKQILDIVLYYTMQSLYSLFNKQCRQTSISFMSQMIREKYSISQSQLNWHNQFYQKVTKSVLKIPNNINDKNGKNCKKFYRGSSNYNYNYKQDQVVEWNYFVSTSQSLKTAEQFIFQNPDNLSHLYLFQLKTFSGKDIKKYSFYNQEQTLLLPYTQYKVRNIQKIIMIDPHTKKPQKVTKVTMLQLPIPKIFKGHLIIWIDNNIKHNYELFLEIVQKYKRYGINQRHFDIILLQSNSHFISWLNEYHSILLVPQLKIHFITNMNRPPHFRHQGIETLLIIKGLQNIKQDITVTYFISNVKKTKEILSKSGYQNEVRGKNPKINIVSESWDLHLIIQKLLEIKNKKKQFKKNIPKLSFFKKLWNKFF